MIYIKIILKDYLNYNIITDISQYKIEIYLIFHGISAINPERRFIQGFHIMQAFSEGVFTETLSKPFKRPGIPFSRVCL